MQTLRHDVGRLRRLHQSQSTTSSIRAAGTWLAQSPSTSLGHRCATSCRVAGQPWERSTDLPQQPQQQQRGEDEYMKEYREMKDGILDRTRKSAAVVALYLLLAVDGQASLLALLGSLFAMAYLMWLFHDVDSVQPSDRVPLLEAEKILSPQLRSTAKVVAAWRQALKPRLLVPASLVALMVAYGVVVGEPLSLTYDGCLLLGFLSYKAALLTLMVPDAKQKKADAELAKRPKIERIVDELDNWGRPKLRTPLPTAALPEGVDVSTIRVPTSLLGLEDDDLAAAEAEAREDERRRARESKQP